MINYKLVGEQVASWWEEIRLIIQSLHLIALTATKIKTLQLTRIILDLHGVNQPGQGGATLLCVLKLSHRKPFWPPCNLYPATPRYPVSVKLRCFAMRQWVQSLKWRLHCDRNTGGIQGASFTKINRIFGIAGAWARDNLTDLCSKILQLSFLSALQT